VVDINLEHMCAKEVEEDPETHNYRFTNNLALGLILILRDAPTNINSHWGPYDGTMKPIPALYVGKYDGMKVRELSQTENSHGTIIRK
ncbi:MAG: hypothetical protein ACTSP6_01990, partial [Promethearchaeota archaeon]